MKTKLVNTSLRQFSVRAFTLLELLLVIAVIAVLAGIILIALNPAGRLEDANDAKTLSKAQDIRKAIEAYVLATGSLPTNITNLPTYGIYNICNFGQSTSCVNLDALVSGGYISEIPIDDENDTTVISGYKLEYNPTKNNVQVYSHDSYTEIVEDGGSLTSGLVGYWKMDEASWVNNCSTGSILDSSGNGNHAVSCPNALGLVGGGVGRFDKGAVYDGTNHYQSVANNAAINPTTAITASAWFKTTDPTGGILSKRLTVNGYRIVMNGSNLYFTLGNGSSITQPSIAGFADGNWHQAVGTWSVLDNTIRIYVDGILRNSGAFTGPIVNTSGALLLGDSDDQGKLTASIDDVRLYNRALNAEEVAALYNYAPPAVAHWKFDEGSGVAAADSSGNGYTGTLTNGPTWVGGRHGNAVNFDGVNDYVDAGSSVGNYIDNFTVTAWVKTSSTNVRILSRRTNTPAVTQYDLYVKSGTGEFAIWTGATTVAGVTNIADGNWHFGAWVMEGANSKIYKDGVVDKTAYNPNLSAISANTMIGAFGNAGFPTTTMNGQMDDVRIYNYALTQAQIQKVMNNEI